MSTRSTSSDELTTSLIKKPPLRRPTYQRRRSSFEASTYNSAGQSTGYVKIPKDNTNTLLPGLSTFQLMCLTICMAGVQFTWTVELSFGTPYLLSLDLSKELTASVWLAGPLSGLIVQPLIGAFSDKCTSRFGKRRPYIVVAGFLTCVSMLGVAYAKEIGHYLSTKLQGDDHIYAILVAVSSFYFLDFTLNAVQAICRALILDIPPLWQQDEANAWSARMSNLAMVMGYYVGAMDLVKFFPWMGDSQMKVFCLMSIFVFCITLLVTCYSTDEKENHDQLDNQAPWYHTLIYVWKALRHLPRPIQTLCNTQFFAWMGWFPFLFYSTQWVSDLYFATRSNEGRGNHGNWADGSRMGSFALLCYSIVSVVAGFLMPAVYSKFSSVKWMSITNIYTASHLLSAACLLSTWFIRTVSGAVVVLSIMGISWAIVLWVPFSLVGEYVSYDDENRQRQQQQRQQHLDYGSSASASSLETGQQYDDDFDAGLILGVHNMYIVFPQFAVAVISAFIFAADEVLEPPPHDDSPTSNVALVLTFGGMMALVAATLSRFIVRVV